MTNSSKPTKPSKPRPDFPLFPHLSGKWAKYIKGKTYYFGSWDDPDGALAEYEEVADDLHAGRVPRKEGQADGVLVRDVCNLFITAKRMKLDSGNLSPRTFIQYDTGCKFLIDTIGGDRAVADLGPSDFQLLYSKLSKKYGTGTLGSQITQVRSVFKHAYESDVIPAPPKYGPLFKSPSKTAIRKAKAKKKHENGSRTFEAKEIKKLLEKAPVQLRAMILLGINCGFGNTDCANLPKSALDLKKGWVDFPRPKTGAERRIPLWGETVAALRAVLANRKEPTAPEDQDVVFITSFRQRWVRYAVIETVHFGKKKISPKADDGISKATTKLLKELEMKRPGLSFYSLRHTFETVAGGTRDQVAVDAIMGHIDSSMAANYRHGIEDERLKTVTEHVRVWLFGKTKPKQK